MVGRFALRLLSRSLIAKAASKRCVFGTVLGRRRFAERGLADDFRRRFTSTSRMPGAGQAEHGSINVLVQALLASKGSISLKARGINDEHVAQFIQELSHLHLQESKYSVLGVKRRISGDRSRLKQLNLPRNLIGDRGALALAALVQSTPSIRVLNLQGNKLGAAGVRALIDAIPRSNLIALNVRDNDGWNALEPEEKAALGSELQQNRDRQNDSASRGGVSRRKRTAHEIESMKPYWNIAIVGGGIAGCAVARALQLHGFECQVFEKDEAVDSRHQGYGLTIQQATQAVRRLGISSDIIAASTWSSRHFIFDQAGKVVAFWGPTFVQEQRARREACSTEESDDPANRVQTPASANWKRVAHHNLHIPRQALRKILFDSLQPDTVRWGHDLQAMSKVDGGKIKLDFGNDRIELADVVIAADGIFSGVRRQMDACGNGSRIDDGANMTPSAEAREPRLLSSLNYLGLVVVLGVFDSTKFRVCHERALQVSDGNTRVFMMPFSKTEAMWQLTFRVADEGEAKRLGQRTETLKAMASELCADWAGPVPNIIESTSLSMMSGYPVYDRDPFTVEEVESRLSLGEWPLVAMVGDAAHCMSPLKGQGANQALLDAVEVADSLRDAWQAEAASILAAVDSIGLSDRSSASEKNSRDPALRTKLIQQHLLDFEKRMIQRTTSKVLGSRKTVDALHCPNFVEPEYQAARKSIGGAQQLKRVQRLRNNNISIEAAEEYTEVSQENQRHGGSTRLDEEAFFAALSDEDSAL